METKLALGILPMLTEKCLKELIHVLEDGPFCLSTKDNINEGETAVSRLIPFEKAIYSRIRSIEDEISDIEEIISKQKKENSIRAKRNKKKHKSLIDLLLAHKHLLNKQISRRLGQRLSLIDGHYPIGFGIRKGYKIVAIFDTEENLCKMYAQMGLVMGGKRPKILNFY